MRSGARARARLAALAAVLLLCAPAGAGAVPERVVGYFPDWAGEVAAIRFGPLSHVIYAFARPLASGAVDTTSFDGTRLAALVAAAHAQGVAVLLAVGGAADSDAFPALATSAPARARFVSELLALCEAYDLDGVDIDWEFPDASTSPALTLLLAELYAALAPEGLLLTAAVSGGDWFGRHVESAAFAYVDWLHLMAYDFSGPWSEEGPHASLEQALGSLDYWAGRGLPAAKTLLGLPFYGYDFARPASTMARTYRDIVQAFPLAPWSDQVEQVYYNGLQTVTEKVDRALERGVAGVMIWELTQDTDDWSSLLAAVTRADGVPLERDNCPWTANPDQLDTGGVGGSAPDGIGDACQCGDSDDDGRVDERDLTRLRERLAGRIAALPGAGDEKCNVRGAADGCDALDLVVASRALHGFGPGLAPVCRPAAPPGP